MHINKKEALAERKDIMSEEKFEINEYFKILLITLFVLVLASPAAVYYKSSEFDSTINLTPTIDYYCLIKYACIALILCILVVTFSLKMIVCSTDLKLKQVLRKYSWLYLTALAVFLPTLIIKIGSPIQDMVKTVFMSSTSKTYITSESDNKINKIIELTLKPEDIDLCLKNVDEVTLNSLPYEYSKMDVYSNTYFFTASVTKIQDNK